MGYCMNLVIGSMEIVSLIVLLVVLYGHLFETEMRHPKDRAYLHCIILALFGICADIPAWLLDGKTGIDSFLYIINLLSLVFGDLIAAAFAAYLYYIISNRIEISRMPFYIISNINVASVATMIIGCCFGKVFTILNGQIIYLSMYPLTTIVGAVSLLFFVLIILKNAKVLGIHDTCVLLTYVLIPAIALVYEVFNPGASFIYILHYQYHY